MSTFHRDRQRLRQAAAISLGFVAGSSVALIVVLGSDLPGPVNVVLAAVLVIGIVAFGLVGLVVLGPRARTVDLLVIEPDRVRSTLPSSVDELRRDEIDAVRFGQRSGVRIVVFETNWKGDQAVRRVPLPRRLAIRYSIWRGYGAISLAAWQVEEGVDQVEAALAELWPDVPRIHA
jgi:hypothetical protein